MLTTVTVSRGQAMSAGDKGSGSVRMLRVATGSDQPRDGRLIKPGDRGKAGSRVAFCSSEWSYRCTPGSAGCPIGRLD